VTEPVFFTQAIEAAWIAEHFDLPLADCDAVLSVEWEFQVATGIAVKPPGAPDWEFEFYRPEDLAGEAPIVDYNRIARDAETLAGVPHDIGMRVLEGEFEFLRLRGLVDQDAEW
jgi:hypothetical protein